MLLGMSTKSPTSAAHTGAAVTANKCGGVAPVVRRSVPNASPAPGAGGGAAGKVIVLANQKGGVGKTTLSCHLVDRLWLAGVQATAVDADPQAAMTAWLRRVDPAAATDGRVVGAPDADALHEILDDTRRRGRVAVVDAPPGVDAVSRVLAFHADLLLVPCGPSMLDLWATGKFLEVVGRTLQLVGDRRVGTGRVRVVPNRRRTGLRLTRQADKAIEKLAADAAAKFPDFDVRVVPTGVGLREPLSAACVAGTTVLRQAASMDKRDRATRRSAEPAAKEIVDLTNAALRELAAPAASSARASRAGRAA